MAEQPRVLIVEDTMVLAETYQAYLDKNQISSDIATTVSEGEQHLAKDTYDVVLLDLGLPDRNGLELLKQLDQDVDGPEAIVITADGSINRAVEAMRFGAFDFLVKPFNEDRLTTAVHNAYEASQVLKGTRRVPVNDDPTPTAKATGLISRSPAMQVVRNAIGSVANSNVPVFITGESGTGKEVCANTIHEIGSRSNQPFIAINCAAIPKDLMESELFGHVKGAFTGATSHRLGAAQAADGGTLFLDEIGELDFALQSKLLRFLQTGQIKQVGAELDEKVDVRIICATNRDPLEDIAAGRFREDLYYRLHVVPIHLPPLRERIKDIDPLLDHFLAIYGAEEGKQFTGFTPEARYRMMQYPWPGNIRELQNTVRHIAVMSAGGMITPEALPPAIEAGAGQGISAMGLPPHPSAMPDPGMPASAPPAPMPLFNQHHPTSGQTEHGMGHPGPVSSPMAPAANQMIEPLWIVEKRTIENAIAQCDGNISMAARLLEISPSTIYRKKEQWEKQGA